jgi:hypothetical protein
MARDPDERYSSVGDLRTALTAVQAGRLPPPTMGPTPDSTVIEASADATPPGGVPTFVESERGWLLPALLIMLVAVALGVAAVLLGRNLGSDLLSGNDTGGGDSVTQLRPVAAQAFDPEGSDGENDGEAGEAIDGDPDTSWTTEGYNTRAFGNLKPGVGLYVELDGLHAIDTIEIDSPTVGWSVEIYVAAEPAATLDGWGVPVGRGDNLSEGAPPLTLDDGAEGAAVLVWITDLGDADPQVRATIAELTITGT